MMHGMYDTDNEALIKESIPSLFTMVLYYLITVPGSIFFNTVAGTGNTKSTFLIEMITAGVYLLAIYFIIFWWRPSVQYCWFVEYIYWIVTLSISFFYLKKANWKNKKI